jgi:hypothetical protein
MAAGQPDGTTGAGPLLDRLWKEAENMLHQAIDPLDDAWLASLEAKGENDAC